jgi:hypothetical protein
MLCYYLNLHDYISSLIKFYFLIAGKAASDLACIMWVQTHSSYITRMPETLVLFSDIQNGLMELRGPDFWFVFYVTVKVPFRNAVLMCSNKHENIVCYRNWQYSNRLFLNKLFLNNFNPNAYVTWLMAHNLRPWCMIVKVGCTPCVKSHFLKCLPREKNRTLCTWVVDHMISYVFLKD